MVVVAAAVGVYANTLWNGFVWDDLLLLVDNPRVKSLSRVPQLFTEALAPRTLYYRPLQALTLATEYAVVGFSPSFFHLTNVALHAGVCVLLYQLAARIFRDSSAALCTTLLFAVHPIHTEAVAYIAGRSDSLSAMCGLGALLLRRRPVLSSIAIFAALLARESGAIFVLLAALMDASGGLADDDAAQASRRRLLARYVGYGVALAAYVALRNVALQHEPSPTMRTAAYPLEVRLLTMVKVLGAYLRLMVYPATLHMERIVPPVTSALEPAVLASAATLAGLAGVVIRWRKPAWPVAFGCAWFTFALLPVSNVVPLDAFMAEHWLYVPSMGIFMAVGWCVARAVRGACWPATAVFAVVLLALGARTVARNMEWRTELSLFEATVRDSPTSYRARSSLGRAYLRAGDTQRAIGALSESLPLARTPIEQATVHGNLGLAHLSEGRYQQAMDEFGRAISLNGPDAKVYSNQGIALLAMDRPEDATAALERAIATDPSYAPAHVNLGVAFEQLGRLQQAEESYRRALRLDPDSVEAHTGLGDVHLAEGRPDLAVQDFREALRLQPALPELRERLDRALAAQGGGAR